MKYRTVVIDPPWPLRVATSPKVTHSRYKDKLPYSTMTLQDIKEFPIDDFAHEDCLLFLWIANGYTINDVPIPEAGFSILREWGFRYSAMIHWLRNQHTCLWSPIRLRTETVLYAWRGKQPIDRINSMANTFDAPRGKHSEKPSRFYQILRSWTPSPRIDIFARNAHEGFEGWGNEYVGDGPLAPFLNEVITRPEIVQGSPSQREPEVN